MSSADFVRLALQVATMLAVALIGGEIMRRFKQPAVVGEMFGGILLGPTILGWVAPSLYEWLFLSAPNVTVVRDALANGVIDARIFVAIVVMALITSLMAGPAISHLLWEHHAMRSRRTAPAMQRS